MVCVFLIRCTAKYLTNHAKEKFIDAAMEQAKKDKSIQRVVIEYALKEYTRNPVQTAVIKALLIAVPLSFAGGIWMYSWWIALSDYFEKRFGEWFPVDEEDASDENAEALSLNPRLLPVTSHASSPTLIQKTDTSRGKSKWLSKFGSWLDRSSEANKESESEGVSGSNAADVVPSRVTYSEEEYQIEVRKLLQQVDDMLRNSNHFNEVERAAILERLAVSLTLSKL